MDRARRRELAAALRSVAPWVTRTDAGPCAVDAGACDRCGGDPRLLPTCGPVAWPALCRGCALEVGTDAWCDGHLDVAEELLAWATTLPPWWADAVVLWWVSTGEVDAPATDPGGPTVPLPPPVRALLHGR